MSKRTIDKIAKVIENYPTAFLTIHDVGGSGCWSQRTAFMKMNKTRRQAVIDRANNG